MLYLSIRVGMSFMFYDWLVFAECIFLSIYFTRVGTHGGGIFFFFTFLCFIIAVTAISLISVIIEYE